MGRGLQSLDDPLFEGQGQAGIKGGPQQSCRGIAAAEHVGSG